MQTETPSVPSVLGSSAKIWLLLLALLCVGRIYLVPVWGSSEAREAHVVREILTTGEIILPLRNGYVPSKPPLLHWLAASVHAAVNGVSHEVTSALGGKGAFIDPLQAARFISLAAAGGVLALVWWFVSFAISNILIPGRASPGGGGGFEFERGAPVVAIIILASSYGFFNLATDARVDMLLCLFVTAATLRWIVGVERASAALPQQQRHEILMTQLWVAGACGAAVLAKGPLGIAFPGLCAICCAFVYGRLGARFLVPRLFPFILFVGIAIPWYLLATSSGGNAFVERQLLFENLSRLIGGEGISAKPWYFYVPAFFSGAPPWSMLVLLTFPLVMKRRVGRVLALYWLSALVFLSVAEGKRSSYLLALWPCIAIQLAIAWHDFKQLASRELLRRYERVMFLALHFTALFLVGVVVTLAGLVAALPTTLPSSYAGVLLAGPALQTSALLLFAWGGAWLIVRALLRWLTAQTQASQAEEYLARAILVIGFIIGLHGLGLAVKAEYKGYTAVGEMITKHVMQEPGEQELMSTSAATRNIALGPNLPRVELYGVRSRGDETTDPMLYLVPFSFRLMEPELSLEQLCIKHSLSGSISPHRFLVLAPTFWLERERLIESRHAREMTREFPTTSSRTLVAATSVGAENTSSTGTLTCVREVRLIAGYPLYGSLDAALFEVRVESPSDRQPVASAS